MLGSHWFYSESASKVRAKLFRIQYSQRIGRRVLSKHIGADVSTAPPRIARILVTLLSSTQSGAIILRSAWKGRVLQP